MAFVRKPYLEEAQRDGAAVGPSINAADRQQGRLISIEPDSSLTSTGRARGSAGPSNSTYCCPGRKSA
jgi:hypothetical protein